jgi:DNA-binding response OmpR family regulator
MTKTLVLQVDDEQLNLEILVEYFEGEELFALQTANSGDAAWKLLQNPEHDFKFVLLYRMMPGLDAMGLLRRMKGDPRLSGIPVIMQTAANSSGHICVGLEAGTYYCLTKPYRRDNLLAIIHAALSGAQARSEPNRKLHQHVSSLLFRDQGSGFSRRNYLEMNPERAFDPNVRGIALPRILSFNRIAYEGNSNTAVATICCGPDKYRGCQP